MRLLKILILRAGWSLGQPKGLQEPLILNKGKADQGVIRRIKRSDLMRETARTSRGINSLESTQRLLGLGWENRYGRHNPFFGVSTMRVLLNRLIATAIHGEGSNLVA